MSAANSGFLSLWNCFLLPGEKWGRRKVAFFSFVDWRKYDKPFSLCWFCFGVFVHVTIDCIFKSSYTWPWKGGALASYARNRSAMCAVWEIPSQHVEWLEYFPSEIQLYHPVRHYSTKMVCHRRFWKELEEKAWVTAFSAETDRRLLWRRGRRL